jgi:hypothetical protein
MGWTASNRTPNPMKKSPQPTASTALDSAPEPWLNSGGACRHLGISGITLRRWVKAGYLKPKRTPTGEFRFKLSDLEKVLA